MPQIIGNVVCVQVGDDFAFTQIRPDEGRPESLILWFAPTVASTTTRMMHSMWLSLLRVALADGLRVRVTYPRNSAFIQLVELRGPGL